MTAGFPEWTLGGVLVTPFVAQALAAAALALALRPVLRVLPLQRLFANPSLVGVCLFVLLLAAVMAAS